MTTPKSIKTSRLVIRPFSEKDITPRYLSWINNKELMRYSEQRHRTHTQDTAFAYLKSFDGTSNYFWAIYEEKHGLGHIGNTNAYVDTNNNIADIGIMIGEEKAGNHGYGLEAWQAVMNFLFEEIGIRKITAGTMAENTPMLKLMKSAGMIDDGVRHRHYVIQGREVDIVHMAAFKQAEKNE